MDIDQPSSTEVEEVVIKLGIPRDTLSWASSPAVQNLLTPFKINLADLDESDCTARTVIAMKRQKGSYTFGYLDFAAESGFMQNAKTGGSIKIYRI